MTAHGHVTPDELPVPTEDLEDLIRGHQIVHLWIDGLENLGFIPGVPCIALELTNGDVHVIAVFPDVAPRSAFVYRLMWRMIQGPSFIKKSRAKILSAGRPQADILDVQKQSAGQVIARAYREKQPGREGGEILVVEFTDGRRLVVEGVQTDDPAALEANVPLAGMDVRIESVARVTSLPSAITPTEAA